MDPGLTPPVDLRIPIDVRTHKRAVYDRLRHMTITFELPPGTRLVESQLAERLGVSKTPVREAIGLLEADGLARTIPYRGAMTTWLSVNEMTEQGFLLDALEVPAYPIVVKRITDAELAAVSDIVDDLVEARRVGDGTAFGACQVAIHDSLFACTGWPRLRALIHQVMGPVGLRYDRALVYPFESSWDMLLELSVTRFEALRQRDARAAVRDVGRLRRRLHALNLERLQLPSVARYFRDEPSEMDLTSRRQAAG